MPFPLNLNADSFNSGTKDLPLKLLDSIRRLTVEIVISLSSGKVIRVLPFSRPAFTSNETERLYAGSVSFGSDTPEKAAINIRAVRILNIFTGFFLFWLFHRNRTGDC